MWTSRNGGCGAWTSNQSNLSVVGLGHQANHKIFDYLQDMCRYSACKMSSDKGGEELVGVANYWSNMRHEPWEGDHVQRCLDGQEPEATKKSRVEPNTTVPKVNEIMKWFLVISCYTQRWLSSPIVFREPSSRAWETLKKRWRKDYWSQRG